MNLKIKAQCYYYCLSFSRFSPWDPDVHEDFRKQLHTPKVNTGKLTPPARPSPWPATRLTFTCHWLTGLNIKHLVYVPVGHMVLKIYVPWKIFHMPSQYLYKPFKAYVHSWGSKYMPSLKNHFPSRARSDKNLRALGQDLHAPGMRARLNVKPWLNSFYPPLQWSWKRGILVSPCASVCPSVRLWTESCPLCIFNNNHQIHFVCTHLINQLQKVFFFYQKFEVWGNSLNL